MRERMLASERHLLLAFEILPGFGFTINPPPLSYLCLWRYVLIALYCWVDHHYPPIKKADRQVTR
jgi:hypothetical protein